MGTNSHWGFFVLEKIKEGGTGGEEWGELRFLPKNEIAYQIKGGGGKGIVR